MGKIVLKTATRATKVKRSAVRAAVTNAFKTHISPKHSERKDARKMASAAAKRA